MFRSSVYLGSLTLACALFYFGSEATGQVNGVAICQNVTQPQPPPLPANFPRVSSTQKGSLLVFSKIEIKWDASGNLIRDTLIDLSNDYPADVYVQGYFINGDVRVEQLRDEAGTIIRPFEPGWNTADCRFQLTGNQPVWWSAARGGNNCQSFTVLDPQGPGRLDPDSSTGGRVLRGWALFWAVSFDRSVGPTGSWVEINWNHLKGDAVIVDYSTGAAWEYNAWAFRALLGERGFTLGTPGALLLGLEYDAAYGDLLLDFYATPGGANPFSAFSSPDNPTADVNIQHETYITLHPMDLDLRQDGCGPVLTKAKVTVCNENEVCFSGSRRCICCWDSVAASLWNREFSGASNFFTRNHLGTDKGKARIEGVSTDGANCDYEEICGVSPIPRKLSCGQVCEFARCPGPGCEDFEFWGFSETSPLLGVAVKSLSFSPSGTFDMAGMNIHGTGVERAVILTDLESGPSESRKDGSERTTLRSSDAR